MINQIKQKIKTTSKIVKQMPDIVKTGLKTVPTTNLMTVSAIVLSVFSVLAFWVVVYLEKPLDSVTLGVVLTFLASWMGLNTRQFRIKRETNFDYIKTQNGK